MATVDLDSVRALKQELYEPLVARGGLQAQEAPSVSIPAERATDVAHAQPGIALGVSAGTKTGDYRLALRIQHRDLVGSSRLAGIQKAARGEVDVRYVGQLTKLEGTPGPRERPLRVGASIGHHAITAGTLGAIVRVDSDNRPRLLSNNHVFADENRAQAGDVIIQPGRLDGGISERDHVATLERFVRLDPAAVNLVDAAVALPDEGIEVDSEIAGIGIAAGIALLKDVQEVAKLGRTTALTRGMITAIEVDNVVVNFSTGALRFDDQIEISGVDSLFSKGGDSGSLIIDPHTRRGVGLLFAGSDQGDPLGGGVTYANPLSTVFVELDLVGLW